MNLIRKVLCFVLAGLLPAVPVLGSGPQPARADVVRTWMSIGGAFVSLGVMGPTAFLLCPEGTPLVNRLIVTIPVAGVAAITGAIAAAPGWGRSEAQSSGGSASHSPLRSPFPWSR